MPAETNLASIAVVTEAPNAWGITPAAPDLQLLRLTGESLKHEKETILSNEVRSDRSRSDLVEVGASASGDLQFELSYKSYEAFFESALYSLITPVAATVTAVAIDGTAETLTGLAADFDGVPVGGWVRITGAANPGNNGVKQVAGRNLDGSVLTFIAGSFTTDEPSVDLTFAARELRNGITRKSFTMERRIVSGADDYFQQFVGMIVGQAALNIASKQIVTGSFTFLGSIGTASDATIDQDAIYTTATTTPVFNGTANVGTLTRDGVTMSERAKSVSITINNNLRGNDAIGEKGNFDVGAGSFQVEGSFEMYFKDNTLYQNFINHTYTSFSIALTDSLGNTMVITIPKMNFSDATPPISGIDADVMQTVPFTAILDPVSQSTMIINFFDAV